VVGDRTGAIGIPEAATLRSGRSAKFHSSALLGTVRRARGGRGAAAIKRIYTEGGAVP